MMTCSVMPDWPSRADTPSAAAEFGATRFEAREWLEVGKVHVIQSAIDRAGGFTELRRITELAE